MKVGEIFDKEEYERECSFSDGFSDGFLAGEKSAKECVTEGIDKIDWYSVNQCGELKHGSTDKEHAYVKFTDVTEVLKKNGLYEGE